MRKIKEQNRRGRKRRGGINRRQNKCDSRTEGSGVNHTKRHYASVVTQSHKMADKKKHIILKAANFKAVLTNLRLRIIFKDSVPTAQ